VAAMLPDADPLHKVTIIPRGLSLGSTSQLPEEDRHNYSFNQLNTMLAILLGGRLAEKIVLDQMTTGAENDFQRVTELAEKMVCLWGMSDLGPLQYKSDDSNPFLGKSLAMGARDCSEDTAQKIDREKDCIVNEASGKAYDILTKNRAILDEITQALIDKEVISGTDVKEIISQYATEP
jgi:cell division protease FtsH